jgi:hypothetical protein
MLYRRPLIKGGVFNWNFAKADWEYELTSSNDDYYAGDSGSIGGYQRAIFAVRVLDVVAHAGSGRQRGQ